MQDEKQKFDETVKGLKKISVEYEEMITFVANRTGYIKFKGIPFITSRRNPVNGYQGPGKNPVFVTNGEEYILISKDDFRDAIRANGSTAGEYA